MNLKEVSKQLPAKIAGHAGQLTITKRVKNGKYYCYYPFPTTEKENVPVIKGNSIELVAKKMHKTLIEKGIIKISKKKRAKVPKRTYKPKTKKQIRDYKLTRQKNLVKSK